MHELLERLKVCEDCGGVNVCYHFLKSHYCLGGCGESESEKASRNDGWLPIEDLTEAQYFEQDTAQLDFTDEDWAWIDSFNGRPAGYRKAMSAGLSRCVQGDAKRSTVPARVKPAPLDVDMANDGNSMLWQWVLFKGFDKPLNDSRSRRVHRNGDVEVVYPWRVLLLNGAKCHICKGAIDLDVDRRSDLGLVFDHVVPVSGGGTHTYDNILPAHNVCNARKGMLVDWWQMISPIPLEEE